jgi:predicted transcriptional regulator
MPDEISEIEESVLKVFTGSVPITLMQITAALSADLRGCPDEVARALARLRRKGAIAGRFSEKDGTWVYWK